VVTNCSNREPCLWFVHLPVLRIAHAHLSSNNFPFKSHLALAYLVKLFQDYNRILGTTLTWIIRRARESDLRPVSHAHIQRSRRTGMHRQMSPVEVCSFLAVVCALLNCPSMLASYQSFQVGVCGREAVSEKVS
jgi:hypothetical protein